MRTLTLHFVFSSPKPSYHPNYMSNPGPRPGPNPNPILTWSLKQSLNLQTAAYTHTQQHCDLGSPWWWAGQNGRRRRKLCLESWPTDCLGKSCWIWTFTIILTLLWSRVRYFSNCWWDSFLPLYLCRPWRSCVRWTRATCDWQVI